MIRLGFEPRVREQQQKAVQGSSAPMPSRRVVGRRRRAGGSEGRRGMTSMRAPFFRSALPPVDALSYTIIVIYTCTDDACP